MMQESSLSVGLRSSKTIPSLYTLPVEVLQRIMDHLEVKHILLSFRYTCTKFYAITNNYNRLAIHLFSNPLKAVVDGIFRILQPENITSLTLWKSYSTLTFDEIDWFFSSIDIHRLTQLRFLNISSLKERHLHTILHHATTISTFTSLKIYDRSLMNDDIIADLSTILALPSIRTFDLDISSIIIDKLSWPIDCKLREMSTRICSHKKWCYIVHHSPYLRKFSSVYFDMTNKDNIIHSISYLQLTSLTLSNIQFSIIQLETLLLPLSSLVHFALTANTSCDFLQRFSQWEHFIKDKLPQLKRFHFHISTFISRHRDLNYINSIIPAFQTLFWLEYKRWYVRFQCAKNYDKSEIILHSSVDANTDFFEYLHYGLMSYFTYTTKNDDRSTMNNIWSARSSFSWLMMHSADNFKQSNYSMPTKCTRLVLNIDDFICWHQLSSFELLSTLINLSQLNEIWLFISCREGFDRKAINNLLERTPNVHTFGISYNNDLKLIIEEVCSVLSHRIDHLKVRVNYIDYMKLILERVEHVSTITFIYNWRLLTHQTEMIEWLNEKQRKFSIANDHQSLQVWLNKNIIESSEVETKKLQMLSS